MTLTLKASRISGRLVAGWRATKAALAEIEAEIPHRLSQVVTDIEQALQRNSFHDRIAEKLAATLHGTKTRRDLAQAGQRGPAPLHVA